MCLLSREGVLADQQQRPEENFGDQRATQPARPIRLSPARRRLTVADQIDPARYGQQDQVLQAVGGRRNDRVVEAGDRRAVRLTVEDYASKSIRAKAISPSADPGKLDGRDAGTPTTAGAGRASRIWR